MPNCCMNILMVHSHYDNEASEAEFRALMKEIGMDEESEKINFSFNHFIPQPPELDVVEGGINDTALALVAYVDGGDKSKLEEKFKNSHEVKENNLKTIEEYAEFLSSKELDDFNSTEYTKGKTILEYGRLLADNIKKHGCASWYMWRINNWGTKCDAGKIYVNDYCDDSGYLEMEFDTDWSPPTEALKHMGLKYPHLTFILKYEEPGCCFMGIAKAQGDNFEDHCMKY